MAEPLRVLHFADLHLGVAGYGAVDPQSGLGGRTQDFLQRLDELLELAREHEVDLTVFAGDAFHSRAPNPTLQREFARRVRAFAGLAPLLLCRAAMTRPHTRNAPTAWRFSRPWPCPGVHVGSEYAVHRLETRRGPLALATAPWPQRFAVAARRPAARMPRRSWKNALGERLRRLAAEADGHDLPRLLVGHFAVRWRQAR